MVGCNDDSVVIEMVVGGMIVVVIETVVMVVMVVMTMVVVLVMVVNDSDEQMGSCVLNRISPAPGSTTARLPEPWPGEPLQEQPHPSSNLHKYPFSRSCDFTKAGKPCLI